MRKSQGFTLIELLIVVAIIAIVAAVAIPNLLQARMRSNEANAIVLLRKYAEAQHTFKRENGGALLENSAKGGAGGYASDFTVLYSGHPLFDGQAITPDPEKTFKLIDKEFAAAKGVDGVPFHGYLFIEPAGAGESDVDAVFDPSVGYAVSDPDNFWATRFALLAVPAISGRTGTKAFYIDDEGVLMMKEMASEVRASESMFMETPLKSASGWVTQ